MAINLLCGGEKLDDGDYNNRFIALKIMDNVGHCSFVDDGTWKVTAFLWAMKLIWTWPPPDLPRHLQTMIANPELFWNIECVFQLQEKITNWNMVVKTMINFDVLKCLSEDQVNQVNVPNFWASCFHWGSNGNSIEVKGEVICLTIDLNNLSSVDSLTNWLLSKITIFIAVL